MSSFKILKNERQFGFKCKLLKPMQTFLLNSNQTKFSNQVSELAFKKKKITGTTWLSMLHGLISVSMVHKEGKSAIISITYFYCFVYLMYENLKISASLIGHTPKAAGPIITKTLLIESLFFKRFVLLCYEQP